MQQPHHAVYDCPHCREALEARAGPWNGWLLCPRCGSPGLPPDASRSSVASRKPKPATRREEPAHGVFVTSGSATKQPPHPRIASLALAALSIVLGSMALLVYLDQLDLGTGLQGLLALALFGLLAKVGKRR